MPCDPSAACGSLYIARHDRMVGMCWLLVTLAQQALHVHISMDMHPQSTQQQGRHKYHVLSSCFHLAYAPADSIAEQVLTASTSTEHCECGDRIRSLTCSAMLCHAMTFPFHAMQSL